ncbi:Spy/CpxP family protein refolding chaperone [Beijerinckia sp. L45]|uniref:Spy/CpxP family protein refolding chaperone n=1 Tax=Beijerinckia sp. L45 TaxID=1641855 RepID=UPI00131D2EF7|nr:Spy/CpxP family protein refolding chaperone [Beijerinckia sp. L45]
MCRFPVGAALGALLGSTAFFSPPAAFAQSAPAANPPQGPAESKATPTPNKPALDDKKADDKAMGAMKAYFDARLAGLHAGLELTPDQAPLWTPVEAAIRDLAKAHAEAHRDHGDEPTDALHQLKSMSERLIRGGQAMKALADASGPLIATLSDDQKERLPKLLDGMPPKKILAKAFNLPEEHEDGDRDGENGHRSGHHHHDQADEEHGPRGGRGDEGRDHNGGDHDFKGRAFGNRDFDDHDFGKRFYRDHERHGDHDRGEDREAERHHNRDHDDFDRDRHGSEDFRHRQDSDDERT